MDSLFGDSLPLPVKFVIALVLVLGVIAGAAAAWRRFGANAFATGNLRGRQPRLAVIDAATVDSRRRLVLIRRDNVEHLIMIGGPTDLVVEANIVRATAAVRDTPAPRITTETFAPPPVASDSAMWPPPVAEPVMTRPVRPAPREDRPAIREDWPPPQPAEPFMRRAETERVSAPAPEVSRAAPPPDHQPPQNPPLRATNGAMSDNMPITRPGSETLRAPPPDLMTDDKHIGEMAHRLEAALRRPQAPSEAPPVEPQQRPQGEPLLRTPGPTAADLMAPLRPNRPPAAETSRPAASEPVRRESKGKTIGDSLEQEMASLLGRPAGKT